MGGTLTQFSLGFLGPRKLFRLQFPAIIAILLQCLAVQADTFSSEDGSVDNSGGTVGQAGVSPSSPVCVALPAGAVAWWRAESNTVDSIGANDGLFQGRDLGDVSYM